MKKAKELRLRVMRSPDGIAFGYEGTDLNQFFENGVLIEQQVHFREVLPGDEDADPDMTTAYMVGFEKGRDAARAHTPNAAESGEFPVDAFDEFVQSKVYANPNMFWRARLLDVAREFWNRGLDSRPKAEGREWIGVKKIIYEWSEGGQSSTEFMPGDLRIVREVPKGDV